MESSTRLALLLTIAHHFSPSLAQSNLCSEVKDFATSNATGTYPIPALSINRTEEQNPDFAGVVGGLVEDSGKSWILSPRVKADADFGRAYTSVWLNTGDTNMTDVGVCLADVLSYDVNQYAFSKEVLQRSVDDNGDCKTMLGEQCVAALQNQYRQQATTAMMMGKCPESNHTVPWECADLVGGGESWLGGGMSAGVDLNTTYTASALAANHCDNTTQPLNASMHDLPNAGSAYNQTIRFPTLWFMSFWPNRSAVSGTYETSWDEDVHVEIRCMKIWEVAEGSAVPPSAQELLESEDAVFAKNVSGDNGGSGGSGGDSGSGGLKVDVVFGVGLAGLVALLLA
ncbi:hypothetical protein K491DRAFT_721758 [Lophiostoma macrostomum CBS 122681]|uniref:Uncharacterized protein n=1 Tax=Lophiostoma macrostomum CBS 122681 TaxID=1314788 RepID=A0A6A6SPA6_9PLEO|nr:hypothetical protein K491DRAFT_721758 [Lophiostoma macrostomum CBS 122681]